MPQTVELCGIKRGEVLRDPLIYVLYVVPLVIALGLIPVKVSFSFSLLVIISSFILMTLLILVLSFLFDRSGLGVYLVDGKELKIRYTKNGFTFKEKRFTLPVTVETVSGTPVRIAGLGLYKIGYGTFHVSGHTLPTIIKGNISRIKTGYVINGEVLIYCEDLEKYIQLITRKC
ncbi:hypothetical protein [Sulfuracidifex tepidarius]|uniref:Uncharacterized protein n=1 Tax=Sulfuracidifex tepidarius TaxID=1294262 RepID=A0A510E5M3_9CREN|nr:hypothetical protein [Sulfuracidifex tepidarius]BBG27776.1 hypothetical protein IC007_2330 [Sulfuracidifex tepidarius]